MMRHNHSKAWTEAEDAYIRTNFAAQTVDKTAAELGRSIGSVRRRAQALGIHRGGANKSGKHPWRQYEEPL